MHSLCTGSHYNSAGKFFVEAAALARTRLMREDPLTKQCYLLWGQNCEASGAFERATKCYLAADEPSRAVHALMRKAQGDMVALESVCEIAMLVKESSAMALAQQLGLRYQSVGEWDKARAVYSKFPDLNSLVYLVLVEQGVCQHLRLGKDQSADPDQPPSENFSMPLVNLVLQSWIFAGLGLSASSCSEALRTLSVLDQSCVTSYQRASRVRAQVSLRLTKSCLMGLAGSDVQHSMQLLAECAEVLYREQMYGTLLRFCRLVTFYRLEFLRTQDHSLHLFGFSLFTLLLSTWAEYPACPNTPQLEVSLDCELFVSLYDSLLSAPHAQVIAATMGIDELDQHKKALEKQLDDLKRELQRRMRLNRALKTKQQRQRRKVTHRAFPATIPTSSRTTAVITGDKPVINPLTTHTADDTIIELESVLAVDRNSTKCSVEGPETSVVVEGQWMKSGLEDSLPVANGEEGEQIPEIESGDSDERSDESDDEHGAAGDEEEKVADVLEEGDSGGGRLDIDHAKQTVKVKCRLLQEEINQADHRREDLLERLKQIQSTRLPTPYPNPFLSGCLLLSLLDRLKSNLEATFEAVEESCESTGNASTDLSLSTVSLEQTEPLERQEVTAAGESATSVTSPATAATAINSTSPAEPDSKSSLPIEKKEELLSTYTHLQEKCWMWCHSQSAGSKSLHQAFAARQLPAAMQHVLDMDGLTLARLEVSPSLYARAPICRLQTTFDLPSATACFALVLEIYQHADSRVYALKAEQKYTDGHTHFYRVFWPVNR